MSGPKWYINASKYGHIDFYDDRARDMSKMVCVTCKQHCNFPEYRQMVSDALHAFAQGILHNDRNAL